MSLHWHPPQFVQSLWGKVSHITLMISTWAESHAVGNYSTPAVTFLNVINAVFHSSDECFVLASHVVSVWLHKACLFCRNIYHCGGPLSGELGRKFQVAKIVLLKKIVLLEHRRMPHFVMYDFWQKSEAAFSRPVRSVTHVDALQSVSDNKCM